MLDRDVRQQQECTIKNYDRTVREREFKEGQPVFARHYIGPRKWVGGIIAKQTGPLSYQVQIGNQLASRHASQLLPNLSGLQDLSEGQIEERLDDTFLPTVEPPVTYKPKVTQSPASLDPTLKVPDLPAAPTNKSQVTQSLTLLAPTLAIPDIPVSPPKDSIQPAIAPVQVAPSVPVKLPIKRELRSRDNIKPRTRFDEEFAGFGSKRA